MKPLEERPAFSRRLIRLRKAKNLTQIELANLTGLSQPVIARYEAGETDPSATALLHLAKTLGVSMNDLMEETPEEPLIDLSEVDPRTLRKALEIATMPKEERAMIYAFMNQILKAHKKKPSGQEDA